MTISEDKLERYQLLKRQEEMQANLPHLYGAPWYSWAYKFFHSQNQDNFLSAANQISKSSTQIRKCIHWATATQLWPKLWRKRPLQFWYLYPSRGVASVEFDKKWKVEWLPRGKLALEGKYAWKGDIRSKEVHAIHFASGVSVYFKSYEQDVEDLQSGSVDAIFFDEELPVDLWDELKFRLAATDGYMHGVFTATKGQQFWREVIEERGTRERLPTAFKQQVSMYDCLTYMDGSPSPWTPEKIERIKNQCKSEAEIQRRVYGRFVVDSGLKYPSFSRERNIRTPEAIPHDWILYGAADVGSGGDRGHPSAIAFVAVSPDYKRGRVFRGWRGDGVQTTAADTFMKFVALKGGLTLAGQFYDWACKDFHTIAMRNGEAFVPAEKSHEIGEQTLNVLFKNEMLTIDDIPELRPLVDELTTLQIETAKNKAQDDFVDALRYCVSRIPWAWEAIRGEVIKPVAKPFTQDDLRRGIVTDIDLRGFQDSAEGEIAEWNDLYDL